MYWIHKRLFHIAGATILLLAALFSTAQSALKTVYVEQSVRRIVLRRYFQGSVSKFLTQNKIRCPFGERVVPGLFNTVTNNMVIRIESAVPVEVTSGSRSYRVFTFASNTKQLLKQLDIRLSRNDKLNTRLRAPLFSGENITIENIQTSMTRTVRPIPFHVIHKRDAGLSVGQTRILQDGQYGVRRISLMKTRFNGKVVGVSRRLTVVRSPIDRIIDIGTKRPTAQRPKTVKSNPTELPQTLHANLVSRHVQPGNIQSSLTVLATAYVGGGTTATGWHAGPGVIAVDPSVIPLGTKLYIPGYGVGYAEDTGGAIVGDHIDVCVSTTSAAYAWGVKTLTIYLLT